MAPVRIVLATCALATAASTACRSGGGPVDDRRIDATASDDSAALAASTAKDNRPGSVVRDDRGEAAQRIGFFRMRRGIWELDATAEGVRYSLRDLDGTPIAEDLRWADLEALDPQFAETMVTGIAGGASTIYAEAYSLEIERTRPDTVRANADALFLEPPEAAR